jgi:hypothetical protein
VAKAEARSVLRKLESCSTLTLFERESRIKLWSFYRGHVQRDPPNVNEHAHILRVSFGSLLTVGLFSLIEYCHSPEFALDDAIPVPLLH